jgi:hypothetical protein
MTALARFGLAARAFVYLVLGWLSIQIARRHGDHQANTRGAVDEISRQPYGLVLLWILTFGLAAYAIWRLSEAVLGTTSDGKKPGPRVASAFGGLIYLAFCAATISFIAGRSHQSDAHQQVAVTARVMRHTDGRWLVGLAGVTVVVIGLGIATQGVRRTFEKDLRLRDMSDATRTVVTVLGVTGTVARGVVFALTGALVVDAAVAFKPRKSTGLDGALHALAHHAYGPWLLGAFALGFIAFGLYGLAEARWSKT